MDKAKGTLFSEQLVALVSLPISVVDLGRPKTFFEIFALTDYQECSRATYHVRMVFKIHKMCPCSPATP
jgi:hypothetical protein